jgi:nucleoside phosphorylase
MRAQISDANDIPWDLPLVRGRIGRHSVICCCSGKGQEETATAVTLLVENAKPHTVVLVGVAGGFPQQGVRRGDVIVARTVHSFDFGKIANGKFLRRPELDFNFDLGLLRHASLVASDPEKLWQSYLRVGRPGENGPNRTEVKVHLDCYVASSNKVVDDPDHGFFAA